MRLSDGVCKICQTNQEDFEHMIIQCQGLDRIWQKSTDTIKAIKPNFNLNRNALFFGNTTDEIEMNTLINTVLSITRFEIWKRRCTNKYAGKLVPIVSCENLIITKILEHLRIIQKNTRFTLLTREMIRFLHPP